MSDGHEGWIHAERGLGDDIFICDGEHVILLSVDQVDDLIEDLGRAKAKGGRDE